MATQPYYYNKLGEMKMNKYSLQKHKPSCRLSFNSNFNLEESSNEIDKKYITMYNRPLNETIMPDNPSIPRFRKTFYQTTK